MVCEAPVGRLGPAGASYRQSLAPGDHDADVTRNTSGKIDDLIADAVAARFQVVGPELKDFLRYSREGLFPARLLLIDGAAVVGAQRVGKSINLNFVNPLRTARWMTVDASLTFSSSVRPEACSVFRSACAFQIRPRPFGGHIVRLFQPPGGRLASGFPLPWAAVRRFSRAWMILPQ